MDQPFLLTLLPLLPVTDVAEMRRHAVSSAVLVAPQCDCVGVHYDAVVGLASEVAEPFYAAVVSTVGMYQFDTNPLASCELNTAEKAHEAGLGVVNKHRLVDRQLAEMNHGEGSGYGRNDDEQGQRRVKTDDSGSKNVVAHLGTEVLWQSWLA